MIIATDIDFEKEIINHPKLEDCKESECIFCGYRDCPHHEPLHYHHDGCPACICDDPIILEVEKEMEDDDKSLDIPYPAGHNWEGLTPRQINRAYNTK